MKKSLFAIISVLLVVLAAAFLNVTSFTIAIAGLMLVGAVEFFSMSKFHGEKLPIAITAAAIASIFALNYFLDLSVLINNPFSLVIVGICIAIFVMEFLLKQFLLADNQLGIAIRALVMFGFFGIFIVHIRSIDPEAHLYIMWLLLLVCSNEFFAYVFNRFLHKTVENDQSTYDRTLPGSIGALVGNLAAIVPLGLFWTNFPVWFLMLTVLTASVIMLLGNVHRDWVKQTFLTHEARPLVPAFGSVYDRLGAFIFITPLAYYFIAFATWSLDF